METQSNLPEILYSPIRLNQLEQLIENCLTRVLNNEPNRHLNSFPSNKPLRLKVAAAYLGLAETSLYALIHQGKIKPLKPGKHVLFTKEMLDAYLKGERPSVTEKTDASAYLLKNKKSAL